MKGAALALLLVLATAAGAAPQDNSIAAATNDLQVRVERQLAYGPHAQQRLDVYLPGQAAGPVLLMVHGGGWRRGDKAMPGVVLAKVRHWTAQGFVVASANYRLLPEADPLEQARDVARALAFVQRKARDWGADAQRVVLMGHSAGAHLVALLDADPALAREQGAQPWRATVSLDSAALDIPTLMRMRHLPLYDQAFGADPAFWAAASPLQRLTPAAPPLLAVCSTRRAISCAQAEAFRRRAGEVGVRAAVQPEAKSHAQIDDQLGLPGPYTETVDRWLASVL